MKKYIYYTFLFGMVLFGLACEQKIPGTLDYPFKILPKPQKIELLKGRGLDYGELTGIDLKNINKRPVMGVILSKVASSTDPGKKILTLIIDPELQETKDPEGYVMVIRKGNVTIKSTGEAGIFYGCQTLEQLLEDARDFETAIPACKTTDYPALRYRSVHFDVKHHLDKMNYYYQSIDRLARYKINAVIFEFEDKLGYKRQPLVAAPQAISIDEMAALTRYASERNIEISPLVQGLGHATFILKHEYYAPFREIPDKRWVFCPMEEGTYQVLFDLYRDAMDATPGSKYLHIGGDEIGDIGLCPRCKPTADEKGVMNLNLYWLNRVCEFIVENGRIPIFWDDMPLKQAGVYRTTYDEQIDDQEAARIWQEGEKNLTILIQDFPKKCVYMRWNYELGRLPGNIRALEWYMENNLPVMVATAAQTGAVLFPKDERTGNMTDGGLVAIQSFLRLANEKGIEGMLCTAWDDLSPHFETYWRGFIASAEYSWSPEGRSLEEFDKAYIQREYGFEEDDYMRSYALLTDAASFWSSAFVKIGDRTDIENALINLPGLAHWIPEAEKEKQKKKTDFSDILIELPDPKNPGKWTELYKVKLAGAEKILDGYPMTSKTLDEFYVKAERNKYHWELFKALNDFQITAPELLIALKQCDTTDQDRLSECKLKIQEALDGFDVAWENLKSVYSETRFIAYPDNYVPDRYFHYASQREDLSWMIQDEELIHKMVREWMSQIN